MLGGLSEITTLKSFLQLSNGRCIAHIYLGTVFFNSPLKPISLQFAFVFYERMQYKIPALIENNKPPIASVFLDDKYFDILYG